jgi:thiol-disulfide isomerase/thioredoxin
MKLNVIFMGIAALCLLLAIFTSKHFLKRTDTKEASKALLTTPFAIKSLTRSQEWLNASQPSTPQELANRIILLDFWTFCCINCMQTIPELQALEDQFGPALTVIGVHSAKFMNEKSPENIAAAVQRYGIKHPIINDHDFKIWNAFDVHSWPTLILLSPDGQVYSRYSGEGNREKLAKDIEQLISAYPHAITSKLPNLLENQESKQVLRFPGKIIHTKNFDNKPALFVSNSGNNQILVIRPDGSLVKTIGSGIKGFLDGSLEDSQFNSPQGLAWDSEKQILYVADTANHRLRSINFATGTVSTIAGTGERGKANPKNGKGPLNTALASPWDLAFFPSSKYLTIAMAGVHQLWIYEPEKNRLRLLAGNGIESIVDGMLPRCTLAQPSGLSAHNEGLFFVDAETSSLRMFKNYKVTTLLGSGLFDFGFKDGKLSQGLLQHPLGLFADDSGIYIADSYNHAIRVVDLKTNIISTLCGNGKPGNTIGMLDKTQLNEPNGVIKIDNLLYITDTNNHRIVVIDLDHNLSRNLIIH